MLHVCPNCHHQFWCLRLWTVLELADFFRVSRGSIVKWMSAGHLKYRLQLSHSRQGYRRVVDSLQFQTFLEHKLPLPEELDPTISDTHMRLIRLKERANKRSRLGVEARLRESRRNLVPVSAGPAHPEVGERLEELNRDLIDPTAESLRESERALENERRPRTREEDEPHEDGEP